MIDLGRPGGMSGAAGGTFGGSEELVKLVKLGIGQKVLGIWNWAFDKTYNFYLARTAPLRSSGGGGFIARRAYRQATTSKNIRVFANDGGRLREHSSHRAPRKQEQRK